MNIINLDDSKITCPSWGIFARGYFEECNVQGIPNGNIVHFTEVVQVNFRGYTSDNRAIYTHVYPCTIIDTDGHELSAMGITYFVSDK